MVTAVYASPARGEVALPTQLSLIAPCTAVESEAEDEDVALAVCACSVCA